MAATVDSGKCDGCGKCVEECPSEAIKIVDAKAVVSDDCSECALCVDVCPNGALSV